jgi:hypothetical protein
MFASFLIGFKVAFQKIREKENFQNDKHDEQFDNDNQPNLPAPVAHVFKAADIKFPNP